ncbi:MAG TPA: TRAP transporter TatT component family protein [Gallionellaceae bacterium]|nr:TRAP transporter TatT component family protein [Gallionellaceae bacterium]
MSRFSVLCIFRLPAVLLALLALGGCASLATSASNRLAGNISTAIANENDPDTVAAGMPSYLLMVDGTIEGDPKNEHALLTGSELYGAYAGAFVKDPARIKRLTLKARDYADRALCVHEARLCGVWALSYGDFVRAIGGLKAADLPVLFDGGAAWAGWIQANSSDWNALAALPKVKAVMAHVVAVDETYNHGEAHLYLGVIDTLLPPALGGKPEEGRAHFERALALSGGRDLMVKVEYAQHYARITYNRELHDKLLKEVLAADPDVPGMTLRNVLAQRQARELLASADSYF